MRVAKFVRLLLISVLVLTAQAWGAERPLNNAADGDQDAGTVAGGPTCAWAEGFNSLGLDAVVYAQTVFDDGAGPALYVAGDFLTAGGGSVNRIVKWDGSTWSALGSGMNNQVNALTVFDDGSGEALYAGGLFTTAGGVAANRIAKWNGATWSALGSGANANVNALAVFDDDGIGTNPPALYAAGDFTTIASGSANRIAKWDGSTWSALGTGMNSTVKTVTVFDDGMGESLYAGGFFATAGGVTVNGIAKWNPSGGTWSALGTGAPGGVIDALVVFDDDGIGLNPPALFAGGSFASIGGTSALYIAKWNGSSWSALGSGMNQRVFALIVFDDGAGDALYAGGAFTTAGGVTRNYIAKWNGSAWSSLGSGMGLTVQALTVFDDGGGSALYAGGQFITASGLNANRIAKWDGSAWSILDVGDGMGFTVHSLTVFDDGSGEALYAGGQFVTAGDVTVNRIGKWNGSTWSALDSGMNSTAQINALEVFDDGTGEALYAGGASFSTAGGVTVSRIAKWNGSTWSALGSGLTGGGLILFDLVVFDDDANGPNPPALYAGGNFTTAGGVIVNNIAKWDGSTWSALGTGTGVGSVVYTLAVFDDDANGPNPPALYAGGAFLSAGGVSNTIRMAKWDGSNWSALGFGLNSQVYALTVFDDGTGEALYAGGDFTHTGAGGFAVSRIAKLDLDAPGGWSPFGVGMSNAVSALTVFDDGTGKALYAGGDFITAGGVTVNRIAKRNGSSWSALGSGMSTTVRTLMGFHDGVAPALYAGGSFTAAGGVVSSYIAKWECVQPCNPPDCNNNGVCDNGTCVCDAGFSGPACACGDGTVDAGEECDDGNATNGDCCSSSCAFEAISTNCRAAAGDCDLDEFCDGAGNCPTDLKSTSECRASAGACDLAEVCDGVGNDCPADLLSTSECRASTGACDPAEACDGVNVDCPVDALSTSECRASGGECDPAEACDGINADCPEDVLSISECRASSGTCDPAEQCDGIAVDCPADVLSTSECRSSDGVCDPAESCDGVNTDCPADVLFTSECRASSGTCDPAEECDGINGVCPSDLVITNCISADGCCAPGCNNNNDNDCAVICGNDVLETGEGCDDGNLESGDGCTSTCEVEPDAAAPDPSGIDKGRSVSLFVQAAATAAIGETALRIRLISLHHVDPPYTGGASVPFTTFEYGPSCGEAGGCVRWVGPPAQYVESTSNPTPFYASFLQCTPHYQDWSTVGLLHVFGSAIVPSSMYEVENLAASCAGIESACSAVSAPLPISTTRWADVEQPYNPPSTTVQPDLGDVGALVNKFRSAPGAPIKARALLAGDDAFGNITTLGIDLGFGHIAACVDAFRGKPYPFTIQSCP